MGFGKEELIDFVKNLVEEKWRDWTEMIKVKGLDKYLVETKY